MRRGAISCTLDAIPFGWNGRISIWRIPAIEFCAARIDRVLNAPLELGDVRGLIQIKVCISDCLCVRDPLDPHEFGDGCRLQFNDNGWRADRRLRRRGRLSECGAASECQSNDSKRRTEESPGAISDISFFHGISPCALSSFILRIFAQSAAAEKHKMCSQLRTAHALRKFRAVAKIAVRIGNRSAEHREERRAWGTLCIAILCERVPRLTTICRVIGWRAAPSPSSQRPIFGAITNRSEFDLRKGQRDDDPRFHWVSVYYFAM